MSAPGPRQGRTRVLSAVLAIVALPVLLAPIEAVSFFLRNRDTGSLVSSGQTRGYVLHVPATYDGNKPAPLVISLHGAGLWGAAQREISQWNAVADREGFVVVYPSAGTGSGPRVWRAVIEEPAVMRDVAFISDLIDKVSADYNIDPARVYVNGLSNGGGMAFVLSCTLSHRIAAVGMVAAAQLQPFNSCTDTRPLPMITFHGTADPVTPYAGGKTWVAPRAFPHIPTWTANWARRNRCAPEPVDTEVAANVTRRSYAGCAANASVELYTVRGGGHDWPGGGPLPQWLCGPVSHAVHASDQMWAFFRRHRLS